MPTKKKSSSQSRGNHTSRSRNGGNGRSRSATKTKDVIALLKEDHANVRELLGKLVEGKSRAQKARQQLFTEIEMELELSRASRRRNRWRFESLAAPGFGRLGRCNLVPFGDAAQTPGRSSLFFEDCDHFVSPAPRIHDVYQLRQCKECRIGSLISIGCNIV